MTYRNALLSVLAAIGLSCHDLSTEPPEDPISQDIIDFVSHYKLPDPQAVISRLRIDLEDLTVFTVSYGEAQDCPSGCFYATVCGLKRHTKIGWLSEVDSSFYDLDSTDAYLFTDEFWNTLDARVNWVYRSHFIPLMIRDLDTPLPVLKRIADGLSTYILPYYGWLLLDNPHVKTNREILTILATLPVFQGDAYAPIREQAQVLLSLMGG